MRIPSSLKIIVLVALLAAAGAFGVLRPDLSAGQSNGAAKGPASGKRAGPPSTSAVEVANTTSVRASEDIRTIGSLQSDESVRIAPEIAGRISEIAFAEGARVRAGDVLVRLDASLARAEVDQARARLDLAKANNERARALSRTGNVTDRARDEAEAAFEIARAELGLAETRLEKHELKAPFDGVVGVRNVSVGAFLAIGTAIVNLESIQTLKVDFRIPEARLAAVKVGQAVEVQVDAVPDRTFTGKIYAINPLVDVNGRSLQVRARIDNSDGVLRPGLFARIVIRGLAERDMVSVPESAVVPKGGDTFVFVVDADRAVERRVRLGQRRAGSVEVVEGLEAGSRVVVAGQQRLRDGVRIEIVPSPGAQPPGPASAATAGSKG